jgi:hypothetical protein
MCSVPKALTKRAPCIGPFVSAASAHTAVTGVEAPLAGAVAAELIAAICGADALGIVGKHLRRLIRSSKAQIGSSLPFRSASA